MSSHIKEKACKNLTKIDDTQNPPHNKQKDA